MPSWAKDVIIGKADEEFCGDYGMCIASLVKDALEYDCMKRKFFSESFSLNYSAEQQQESNSEIKFANGKTMKGGQ